LICTYLAVVPSAPPDSSVRPSGVTVRPSGQPSRPPCFWAVPPVVAGSYVIVGDGFGYIHVLSVDNGEIVGRLATDGSAIVEGIETLTGWPALEWRQRAQSGCSGPAANARRSVVSPSAWRQRAH